jgi:hypothetical protein
VRRAAGLTVATLLSATVLAACGGSGSSAGLIPTSDAVGLGNDLSALESALSEHSCDNTQTALNDIFTDISTLPTTVNTKLRDNLLGGYEQLDNTARTQCRSTTHTHTPTGPSGPTQTTSPTGPTQTTSPTGPTQTTSPTGPTQTTSPTGPTIGPGGGSQAPTGGSGTTTADAGGAASAP